MGSEDKGHFFFFKLLAVKDGKEEAAAKGEGCREEAVLVFKILRLNGKKRVGWAE